MICQAIGCQEALGLGIPCQGMHYAQMRAQLCSDTPNGPGVDDEMEFRDICPAECGGAALPHYSEEEILRPRLLRSLPGKYFLWQEPGTALAETSSSQAAAEKFFCGPLKPSKTRLLGRVTSGFQIFLRTNARIFDIARTCSRHAGQWWGAPNSTLHVTSGEPIE